MKEEIEIVVIAEGESSKYNENIKVCEDFPMPRPLPLRPLQDYDLIDGSTIDNMTAVNFTEELVVLYTHRSPCIPWPNLPNIPPTNSTPQEERSESQNFLERLWAYLTIEDLLDEKVSKVEKNKMLLQGHNITDEAIANKTRLDKAKALKLALDYNFVTQLTSLVVVQPDNSASQENTTSKMMIIDPVPVEEISRYSRYPTFPNSRMRHLDKYGNPISSGNFYGGYSRSASMSATRKTYNAPNSRKGLSGPPVIIGRKTPSGKTIVTKSRSSGGRRVVKSRNRSYTPRQTMIFSDKRSYNHMISRLHPIQHRVQTTSGPIFTTSYHNQIKMQDSLEDDLSGYSILKDCEINLYPKTYLRGSKTTITSQMNYLVLKRVSQKH